MYRTELEEHIRQAGLSERMILTGNRADVPELMRAMDVFVLPSLREPFGIVMLEAQACGTPVVGTRVDGIPETMEEGVTGLLVPPADGAALADAVLELLGDPGRRQRMAAAGVERVRTRFGKHAMAEATAALYERVAAGRGVGGGEG
jgi:glycosyltransferase involved in cell wall biosynthesis